MKKLLLIYALCQTAFLSAQNQAVKLDPDIPQAGSELCIRYDLTQKPASLRSGEQVFAGISMLYYPSFEYRKTTVPLNIEGNYAKAFFDIPEKVMQITIYFYSASTGSLDFTPIECKVNRKNGKSTIARFSGYPYRNRWFSYPYMYGKNATEKIHAEMNEIINYQNQDPLGVAFSLAYGYMLTDEIEKSMEQIDYLLKTYPNHQLTFQTLESFAHRVHSGQINDSTYAAIINQEIIDMVKRNLSKPMARQYIRSNGEKEISTTELERICRSWMDEEKYNALPYLRLTNRYVEENQYPTKIIGLSDKGIQLLLNPKSKVYFDLKGMGTRQFISQFNHLKARALLSENHYTEGLCAAYSSQSIFPSAKNMLLIGDLWFKVGNIKEAEAAWTEALKKGEFEARNKLSEIFSIHHPEDLSFDQYIDKLTGINQQKEVKVEHTANTVKSNEKLPAFSGKTIDGKTINSVDLMGRILVLNFWSLGCGPCRAEMPDLNKLVAKYEDQNVLFLSFGLDTKESINTFLKKKDFDYEIIYDAMPIFQTFGVKVQPTHIIIDQQGWIYERLIGGNKKNIELLEGILNILTK